MFSDCSDTMLEYAEQVLECMDEDFQSMTGGMTGWEIRVDCCCVCGQRDVLGYVLQDEDTLANVFWCSSCMDEHSDRMTPFLSLRSNADEDIDQASSNHVPRVACPEVAANVTRQKKVAEHGVDAHPAFAQMECRPKRQRTGERGGIANCAKDMENGPIRSTATSGGS
mmetsp:Transcript_85790/g.170302  ORF Transcript_85790/g.170302 Transcript_85790/m.170302 type:complete len:168 (-) Transcript_85790:155-658(-)